MEAPFDPTTMPPDSLSVVVGRRQTGKTTLAAHLAASRDIVAVFVAGFSDARLWFRVAPDTAHVAEFREDRFLDEVGSHCLAKPKGCVVIEDGFVHRDMNDVLQSLASHAGMGAIITAQVAFEIKPTFKGIRYWFAFKETVKGHIDGLWARACSGWLSAEAFHAIFAEVTAHPYTALVVDRVEQRVWRYTVP